MKFAVIEIQQDDNEIAFEVFETLNAKGQPLAEVDKFRNGFFMLDPENSDANGTWEDDENTLSDHDTEDFRSLPEKNDSIFRLWHKINIFFNH
jgi:uncharacterized protein with ParB-like and HNH nuclease domain